MAKKSNRKSKPKKARSVKKSTTKSIGAAPLRIPSLKDLNYLAKLSDECKTRASSASGEIGGEIRTYAENKGLNPKAFRLVDGLRRIGLSDPIKLRGVLDHFDEYRRMLKIDDLRASDMMAAKPKKPSSRSKAKGGSGDMKPIGDAAGNVVNLASEMQKAIDADKTANGSPKDEMVA